MFKSWFETGTCYKQNVQALLHIIVSVIPQEDVPSKHKAILCSHVADTFTSLWQQRYTGCFAYATSVWEIVSSVCDMIAS